MNYFQHFVRNLRPAGRAEGPCIGTMEGVESAVALYLNPLLTAGIGIGGGMFFVAWELYGEKVLGEHYILSDNSNRNVSYRKNPLKALAYDGKVAFTYDFPRTGRALWAAPKYIVRTTWKGRWGERRKMIKNIGNSLWTGLTAELLAIIPASFVIERLIPIGKELSLRDPEYWLSWLGALVAGWTVGTLGIATKLGWDDYRKEKRYYQVLNSK